VDSGEHQASGLRQPDFCALWTAAIRCQSRCKFARDARSRIGSCLERAHKAAMISLMLQAIKQLFSICAVCLAVAGAAQAQNDRAQLPDAPIPNPSPTAHQDRVIFHKKIFWTMVAACGASAIADAQTSYSNEQRFPNGSESDDWLLGRRPSLGRYYATFALLDGAGSFLSYKLLHSRRKPLRVAGWGVLAGMTAAHAVGAIRNVGARSFASPAPSP
jgi:hypothetical protein